LAFDDPRNLVVEPKSGYVSRLHTYQLKREKGKLSDNQAEWLSVLSGVEQVVPEHIEVWIWRPSDWPEIEEVLR